ncbi:CIS tube protein [Lutibacter citreus]|uniref:CIS tube protein n=1 Tax=Lutibacter citreus TaxID=2138210 RepID=UPI000DBE7ED7|nr:hypothetical protein [Lutibacter citreus]
MIGGALGIIDKMRIEVYADDGFNLPLKTIFVQVNPESYTINKNVEFCEGQAIGTSNQSLQFNKIGSEEVSFDFIFDSSGVIPPAKIKDGKVTKLPLGESLIDVLKPAIGNPFEEAATIEEELEEFKKLVSGYNGDKHQTRYLRLIWGGYLLECRLTSITVQYKMFRKDGRPIRATATCKFKGTQSYEEMQAEQNQQSPDVTHQRIIEQHNKLTLLAEKTYNENQYYIDVAKANNLLTFKRLSAGQNIILPPLK